jgi:hypothetical protein
LTQANENGCLSAVIGPSTVPNLNELSEATFVAASPGPSTGLPEVGSTVLLPVAAVATVGLVLCFEWRRRSKRSRSTA